MIVDVREMSDSVNWSSKASSGEKILSVDNQKRVNKNEVREAGKFLTPCSVQFISKERRIRFVPVLTLLTSTRIFGINRKLEVSELSRELKTLVWLEFGSAQSIMGE